MGRVPTRARSAIWLEERERRQPGGAGPEREPKKPLRTILSFTGHPPAPARPHQKPDATHRHRSHVYRRQSCLETTVTGRGTHPSGERSGNVGTESDVMAIVVPASVGVSGAAPATPSSAEASPRLPHAHGLSWNPDPKYTFDRSSRP